MTWLAGITFLTGLVLVYIFIGRPYLRRVPGLVNFFKWIEPIEIKLWSKSEALLWARWQQLVGILISLLTFIGQIDATPFYGIIPVNWQWVIPFIPLAITISGQIAEFLRRNTTKPIELVALPDKGKPIELVRALSEAEAAKETAVEIVREEQRMAA